MHQGQPFKISYQAFWIYPLKIAIVAHISRIVHARWGKPEHINLLYFGFVANKIVTSMLLLEVAATVKALTGMDYRLDSLLIYWGIIMYTSAGGLNYTLMESYIHTGIIFIVLIVMILVVCIIWSIEYSEEECKMIYSKQLGNTKEKNTRRKLMPVASLQAIIQGPTSP